MKTPLSLLSLLALTAVSCQSAAGPEFEAGLTRVSFGGGFNQTNISNNETEVDLAVITDLDLDLSAGLFLCEDIEVGGIFSYFSESTDFVDTTTDTDQFGLQAGVYGRWYFDQSEYTRHWVHGDISLVNAGNSSADESGAFVRIGLGHTHFLTDSAALEIGAFYGTRSIDVLDTNGIDITAAYSIFW